MQPGVYDGVEWKWHPNLKNILISENGETYSNFINRLLKGRFSGKYLSIGRRVINGYKSYLIHVAVGVLFIPNPDNKPVLNHKNGNKVDNRKSNLEWATHSENSLHAVDTGLNPKRGQYNQNAKFLNKDIPIIKSMYDCGINQISIAAMFQINQSSVSRILNNISYHKL